MATLGISETTDFTGQTLANINTIRLLGSDFVDVTFTSDQFGPGLISDTVNIIRADTATRFIIAFSAAGSVLDARGWTFENVNFQPEFSGTDGGEKVYGTRLNDVIDMGGGFDQIFAGRGFDQVYSGDGDGPDSLDGGRQLDSLFLDRSSSAESFSINLTDGGGGRDIGDGTLITSIERLNAKLGSGNDTVRTGNRGNTVEGGGGNDTIIGGTGGETITGGLGRDALTGGGNQDVFVYTALTESRPGAQADLIRDFETSGAEGADRIDIGDILIDLGVTLSVSSGPFSGVAGEMIFTRNAERTRTFLDFDSDGDSDSDMRIAFVGELSFSVIDFIEF